MHAAILSDERLNRQAIFREGRHSSLRPDFAFISPCPGNRADSILKYDNPIHLTLIMVETLHSRDESIARYGVKGPIPQRSSLLRVKIFLQSL